LSVVEQDLVRSSLDQKWRQSGQVGEERADLRRGLPLLRDVTTEIERALAQELVEGLALLAAHDLGPGSSNSVR